MNILIVCQHFPMCLGRRLLTPFQRLGHDVRHIGTDMGTNGGCGEVHPRHVWKSQGDWHHAWDDWTPDVILWADTLYPDYRHAVYREVPHVHYNSAGAMDAAMPSMDWTFTAVSFGDIWQKTERVSWMPCAYNADWITPSAMTWQEREYDVCMVGRLDAMRMSLLDALEDAGLKVFRHPCLVFEDYAAAYHNSRMGLVQTQYQTIPNRVFETPALGCVSLMVKYREYDKLNIPESSVLYFDENEPDSLIRQAWRALEHPEWAMAAVNYGAYWALQHSWDKRAAQILAILGEAGPLKSNR